MPLIPDRGRRRYATVRLRAPGSVVRRGERRRPPRAGHPLAALPRPPRDRRRRGRVGGRARRPATSSTPASTATRTTPCSSSASSSRARWSPADLRASFAPVARRWDMRWDLHVPATAEYPARLAVLVSRQAHCLYDLLGRCATGDLAATVVSVISNHDDHAVAADRFGVPFHFLPVTGGDDDARAAQEAAVAERVRAAVRRRRGAGPLHARPVAGVLRRVRRADDQHPPLVPAGVRGRPRLPPGLGAGREAHRRHRPLRHRRPRRGSDHRPGRRARLPRRHTGVAHRAGAATLEAVVLATAVRAHLDRRVIAYANRTVVFE